MSRLARQSTPLLLAILLAFVPATVAACGSDGGNDVNSVLEETFSKEKRIDSGKLNMDVSANLEGLPQASGPVSVKVSGPFQSMGETKFPKLDLDLTAKAGGQTVEAGVVSTGDKGFVSFQGTDYSVPDRQFRRLKREVEQAERQNQDDQPDLGALGIDPRQWLENPRDEGTEDVAGTETIHIAADVNVGKLLDDIDDLLKRAGDLGLTEQQREQLPQAIPPSAKKQIEDSVEQAEFDLYTGKDDKILRKLELRLRFQIPENLREQLQGLRSGDIDFSVEIADLNKPQDIKEPEDVRPLSDLRDQFAGSFGQSGGSGGSGGSSSGGGSGGGSPDSGGGATGPDVGSGNVDPDAARQYLRCVEQASGTQDLRKCAEQLR